MKKFKTIFLFTPMFALFCTFVLAACAGGSRGTGGRQFEGTVIRQDTQAPIPGLAVAIAGAAPGSPQTTVTDSAGRFLILDDSDDSQVTVTLVAGNLNTSTLISNIDPKAERVLVTIAVNINANSAQTVAIGFDDDDDDDDDGNDNGSGNSNGNSNDNSDDNSNDDDSSENSNDDSNSNDDNSNSNSNDDDDDDDDNSGGNDSDDDNDNSGRSNHD